MKALTFEIRAHIPGTNMFAEETFKTEVSLRELQTVVKATKVAMGEFVDASSVQSIAESIITRLYTVKGFKSIEILSGPIPSGNGSFRVLAKNV